MKDRGTDGELRVQLLGGFRLWVGGRPVAETAWRLRKAKMLVKLLLLAPERRLHREQVIDVLWPDLDVDAAGNQLRKALHVARRALDPLPDRLRYDGELLALDGPVWVDLVEFEGAAAALGPASEPDQYRAAVDLYTGELLPEDRYEEWVTARRERAHERYVGLAIELARRHEARGELDRAIDTLLLATASDPTDEAAHARLMRLHALAGRRHQALRVYTQLKDALAREIEVEPEPETQRLHEEILAGRFPVFGAPALPVAVLRARASPPLTGRGDELDHLEELLESSAAGRGRVVLISGEAGVGKSRLAGELAERAREQGAIVLWGSAGDGRSPYAPFAVAIDGFASLAVQPDQGRLFDAVAARLSALTARAPVVLVLDELEAADEASLQLVAYLARRAAEMRLLLMGLFRSEGARPAGRLDRVLTALAGEGLATRIDLARLGARGSELLVRSLLGIEPVDRAAFDAVFGIAAGNAQYTEETVRILREQGQLVLLDGRWRLSSRATPTPDALASLVSSRLEQLSPRTRAVLDALSVLGEASYPLLRAVSELPHDDALEALDDCMRSGLAGESARGYRFDHPLYRRVVYERLGGLRTALHGRVAAVIESHAPGRLDTEAEELAHHWLSSDQPHRALPYLLTAAERAESMFAHERALERYQQALELVPNDAPERAPLLEKVGDLAMLAGLSGVDRESYEAALASDSNDPAAAMRLHRKLAAAHLARHEADAAAPHVEAAAALASSGGDMEGMHLHAVQTNLLCERGHIDEAIEAAEEMVAEAERHGTTADLSSAYQQLAIAYHFKGAWPDGLHLEIERLGAADEAQELTSIFDVHHCMGQYYLYGPGPFEDVERYARVTLDLAERGGARRAQAFAWCLLGESLLLRGHWDEAAACLERGTEIYRDLGTRSGALLWQRLAELSVYRGAYDEAERYLRHGTAIATVSPMAMHLWGRLYATRALDALEQGDPRAAARAVESAVESAQRYGQCPSCAALLHPVAAEAYAALGEPDRAAEHAQQAEATAALTESPAWSAMAASAHGWSAYARGEASEARRLLLEAADLYERAEQPFWMARSLLQAAALGGPDATPLLERSVALFERLGAAAAYERAVTELSRARG